jgi:hypothetical protein
VIAIKVVKRGISSAICPITKAGEGPEGQRGHDTATTTGERSPSPPLPWAIHCTMAHESTESTPLLSTDAIDDGSSDAASSAGDLLLQTQRSTGTRLANSYRRPSFAQAGGRGLLLSSSTIPESALRDDEAFDLVREEAGLLKRNSIGVMPTSRRGSVTAATVEEVEETWEEAVKAGRIKTSWRYELMVLTRYSVSFPDFHFSIASIDSSLADSIGSARRHIL